jgi:hypothetical protein
MRAVIENENGPASVGALPDRGSNIHRKDIQMNDTEHNSSSSTAPARNFAGLTHKEILDALEDVDCSIAELRRASMVADEYVNFEIRAGNCGRFKDHCHLTPEQVDGILYMMMHVRDACRNLEQANDRAYGREVRS